MICKKDFKQKLVLCVYGASVYMMMNCIKYITRGFEYDNPARTITMDIVESLLLGVIYALLILLFTSIEGKNVKKLRSEIAESKKIICEGPALLEKGLFGIDGWMFLTEDGLEFYPNKKKLADNIIVVSPDDITNMKSDLFKLKIQTKAKELCFSLRRTDIWKETVTQMMSE